MHCQLTELHYYSVAGDSYRISDFLSIQPTIEKLLIISHTDSLSNIDPNALPALRELSAPVQLLSTSPIPHLPCLSRLSVILTLASLVEFVQLAGALQQITPPRSLELCIAVNTNTDPGAIETITIGLAYLGLAAPFITSLELEIYQGHIQQHELHYMLLLALPRFPNLRTLTLMSPPPTQNMNPRDFQMRSLSHTISLIHNTLSSLQLPIDTSFLPPALQSEPSLTQDQPNSDALYDRSCHTKIIRAWGQIHPSLEYVVFPFAVYNLKAFRST
ncbi:unnamed protein product [Rhizoctonia solani]|uniref:Uncharacterized protein n=1 Tax=Rhizoctonia solani TaxID=456999 RepID=A0A8H2XTE6_9AGAM|nr:unnamed protein product [Rhizoctonia solani]